MRGPTPFPIFNRHLTNLLLGGLICREVLPDDVTAGSMNFWGYHRHGVPEGRYAKLSQALRTRRGNWDEVIHLMDKPIRAKEYSALRAHGAAITQLLPDNFPSVFLAACTDFCNEEWERALILGWSSAELLVSELWDEYIVGGEKVSGIGGKRRKNFLSDTRSWTSSNRIEMLWQKGLLVDELYVLLDRARRARNDFIHAAAFSDPEDARAAIEACLRLIESLTKRQGVSIDLPFLIKMLDHQTSRFRPPIADDDGRLLFEPQYWRSLDPAPGFADWGDRPFEKIPEIQFKKLRA
jgi:hypothetical protein